MYRLSNVGDGLSPPGPHFGPSHDWAEAVPEATPINTAVSSILANMIESFREAHHFGRVLGAFTPLAGRVIPPPPPVRTAAPA
jgi:hypothetical protein